MIERAANWIFLLMIITIIDHSFSAVFINFGRQNPEENYKNSRSTSVYRGQFLTYSTPEKSGICADLLSEFVAGNTVISDGLKNEGQAQHSLIVGKISQFVEHYWLAGKVEDLFFKCAGKNLAMSGAVVDMEYFVSSTFRRGFIYEGAYEYESENMIGVMINGYLGMSPVYATLGQAELEKQYVATRQIIKALQKESPTYVKMIKERDIISKLSTWQKFLLCSSIIQSPTHENDRPKFPTNWVDYTKNVGKGIDQYKQKRLTLDHNNNEVDDWWADCLYCVPSTEAAHDPSTLKTNLLITPAYNDKHSLYVLIEDNGVVRLKKYAENAPILMNAHVPFTDEPEYIHPSQLQ